MKVRSRPFIALFIPFAFCPYSLSHYHHWSGGSSCVPLPYRQTSDPALNCRIIYHCHSLIYHCHRMTSMTPRSFGAHYLPVSIQSFLFLKAGRGHNSDCAWIAKGGGGEVGGLMNGKKKKRNTFRGMNRMTWDTTCQTSPQRPLPCLQPTLAIIYREPQT